MSKYTKPLVCKDDGVVILYYEMSKKLAVKSAIDLTCCNIPGAPINRPDTIGADVNERKSARR